MERHGICKNVGVCSRANKEQIITDDDAEFVCPECGEPLEPVKEDPKKPGGNGKKKPLLIGAAVIVLAAAGIGGGLLLSNGDSKSEKAEPEKVETNVADTVTTKVSEEPVKEEETDKKDAEETEVKADSKKSPEKGESKPAAKKTPKYSFATFDGTTMTFKQRHTIPGTSQVAEPGDKVTGVWENGEVNSVRWYHADGTASEVLTHE